MGRSGYTAQRDELLESIDRSGAEVRGTLQELKATAESKLDLGEWIRAAPMAWTLGAFLVGAWFGDRATAEHSTTRRRRQR